MPRKPRFAPPGYWYHVTQRGNYRQKAFFSDADYHFFVTLLAQATTDHDVALLAYCVMPNHLHLIVQPQAPDALSHCLNTLNGQDAQALHARLHRRGRFWQGRFYACLLDEAHLLTALRYVELNPVRARLAPSADAYPWSSAAAHTGTIPTPDWLAQDDFATRYSPTEWRTRLQAAESRCDRALLRTRTQWERPLASPEFIAHLEHQHHTILTPRPIGRPRKPAQSETASTAAAPTRSAC